MELKIPIEIVFDDVNSVIDELGKLQKYKLGEGDDMTLVDVDDVVDVLTRHVMAREAKEPCETKEGWIPCSEKKPETMPKTNEDVLLQFSSNMGVGFYQDGWAVNTGEGIYSAVDISEEKPIAWMPLPKPYGGESE